MRITGASPTQYDGDFIITVVNANTFTYTMASTPGSNASGQWRPPESFRSSAILYTGPITLAQSARIKARVLNGTTWSALDNQQFYVNPPAICGKPRRHRSELPPGLAPAAGSAL